jgi:uncharacterized protein (DUF1501 family)
MSHRFGCRRTDHPRIGRRDLLHVCGLSLFGLAQASLAQLAAAAPARRAGKAKAAVFIFQSGGPSQHETFDPKPDAPDGIRGEYGTTQTRLPGVRFCEYLPKLAARSDKFAVVRTMHHTAGREFRNEHNSATYLLQTGRAEMPPGDTNASIGLPRAGRFEWPSIGSLVASVGSRDSAGALPPFVELPRTNLMRYAGRGAGVLGPKFEPWGVNLAPLCRSPDPAGSCPNCFSHDDPNDPERAAGKGPKAWWDNSSCRDATFKLPDLGGISVSTAELENRSSLLGRLDAMHRTAESPAAALHAINRKRAVELISTLKPGAANPFDLSREAPSVRDRYGREEWGQGFLVARRLVEAGVRMVQVNLRGWDTHQNAFRDLKGKLLPSIDRCLSGFLDDLDQRGLMDEVLVVMCGEMGRTPKVSPITAGGKNASGEIFTPGRHHWGDVFPCFFAGAGVRGGQVIGQTDRHGGVPATEGYTPADLAATILHLMGVSADEMFRDAEGRPHRITEGTPIRGLLA